MISDLRNETLPIYKPGEPWCKLTSRGKIVVVDLMIQQTRVCMKNAFGAKYH